MDDTTRSDATGTPCPVAETMLRVQAMLRHGTPPSFEALFAYGEPSVR
jgi:hypothetical protein